MKRLIKTVELEFFRDDANGEYGLTHKDTQDDNYGTAFNAFWDGRGIFHDVFEHSHERTHKYFWGDYAMNVGGEMAAMGMMWYYYDVLGVRSRLRDNGFSRYSTAQSMKETTLILIQDALYSGYCQYGYSLESIVPKQKPVDNWELEEQISDFWREIKKYYPNCNQDEQEKEFADQYRKSLSFGKIADLHRYGFRMGKNLVPDTVENRDTLENFLTYWTNLCEKNDAKEMDNLFRGITFKLYKDKGEISWTATFNSKDIYEIKSVKVNGRYPFHMEDAYKSEYQY